MHSPSSHHGETGISRRSFVELAVGTITMLPAVTGGFVLTYSPEEARAAESSSPVTQIVIAKPNEAGIAVADVSGNKRTPVAGAAHVQLAQYERGGALASLNVHDAGSAGTPRFS